jgi:ATP-dependent Lon protease
LPESVRDYIIVNYAREAGVRSLKKYTNRIMEKIAFKFVESGSQQSITVDESSIEDFIGCPVFPNSRIYKCDNPPGVVTGLAYNQAGGSILFIEATQAGSGSGALKVTGSLGEVMKESSSIAQTYAKNFLHKYFSNTEAVNFLDREIHIHFPESAVPKDGPSAGITITASLIGLALNKSTVSDIAMTGEISLNGKVLKIGGVKEKTMAAAREGLKILIFPNENRKDVERLPENVK